MERKLRMYYDAEFTGLHRNTTLISIGLVSENGACFYAEFTDYDQSQITDWLDENVIQKLKLSDKEDGYRLNFVDDSSYKVEGPVNFMVKGNTEMIKNELLRWLMNESEYAGGVQIQFFTDCYAYDWVTLNDLICPNGEALKLPEYINYIPIDLSTALYLKNIDPDISREEFIGNDECQRIKYLPQFNDWSGDYKHNCLWDAYVCQSCFDKLKNTETNNSDDDINILDQEI